MNNLVFLNKFLVQVNKKELTLLNQLLKPFI